MSLLSSFPHVATAKRRNSVGAGRGPSGGTKPTFPTTLFTDKECWRQNASDREITEFSKRGISVTDRFYFLEDPGLSEEDVLTDVRDKDAAAGTGTEWEVRSEALPDASAGLGVVFRVMAVKTSTGST